MIINICILSKPINITSCVLLNKVLNFRKIYNPLLEVFSFAPWFSLSFPFGSPRVSALSFHLGRVQLEGKVVCIKNPFRGFSWLLLLLLQLLWLDFLLPVETVLILAYMSERERRSTHIIACHRNGFTCRLPFLPLCCCRICKS